MKGIFFYIATNGRVTIDLEKQQPRVESRTEQNCIITPSAGHLLEAHRLFHCAQGGWETDRKDIIQDQEIIFIGIQKHSKRCSVEQEIKNLQQPEYLQ